MEAQALPQTSNPEEDAMFLASEIQHGTPFSETSTWTGLIDLDTAGIHSLTRKNGSSEISEERVVIHLKSEDGWKQNQEEGKSSQPSREEEQSDGPRISNKSDLSELKSPESHGDFAHEEERAYFVPSDIPNFSTIASSTPQTQTSNSMLAEFVMSLMRPFRSWTGGEDVNGTPKRPLGIEENTGDDHGHIEASSRNLSIPKTSGNQGNMDNTTIEHKSHNVSFGAPMSPDEGLSDQEKEVTPPSLQVQAVPEREQSDTKRKPVAYIPLSAVHGMFFFKEAKCV